MSRKLKGLRVMCYLRSMLGSTLTRLVPLHVATDTNPWTGLTSQVFDRCAIRDSTPWFKATVLGRTC